MYYLFYMQYMAIHGITWLYMGIHANTWLHMAVQGYTCQYIILNAFLIHFNNPTESTYPQPLHQDLRTILIFTGGVVGGAVRLRVVKRTKAGVFLTLSRAQKTVTNNKVPFFFVFASFCRCPSLCHRPLLKMTTLQLLLLGHHECHRT